MQVNMAGLSTHSSTALSITSTKESPMQIDQQMSTAEL